MPTDVLHYAAGLALCFLGWTLVMYWLHRLSHVHHRYNLLWRLHTAHHRIPYLSRPPQSRWPTWPQYFGWLGTWRATLDVLVVMTLPLLLLAIWLPHYGVPLLVFHYLYEVFLSEYMLDHNPRVTGTPTRWFAWGDFHLHHHSHPRRNYGLLITLWDRVFRTADDPPRGAAMAKIAMMLERARRRALGPNPAELPEPLLPQPAAGSIGGSSSANDRGGCRVAPSVSGGDAAAP